MIIEPFLGILYNKKKIGNFAKVCAPPYDIISSRQQDGYYKKSPYNVIRLELNRSKDPYRSAAGFLNDWIAKGILEKDNVPAVYIYGQSFTHKGKLRRTLGFIAAAKIEQSRHSQVRPHEMTFKAPKEDREKILEIVGVNLSCIYTLVEDKGLKINSFLRKASEAKPFIDVKFDKVRHRIWKMLGEKDVKKLQQFMKDKQAFIADGHHRYEAAANFRDKNNTPAANYIMMYFASMEDKDLTILATHRVVKELPSIPKNIFDITPVTNKKKMFDTFDKYFCGMYANRKFFVLKLKNNVKKKGTGYFFEYYKQTVVKKVACPLFLDVTILHNLILKDARDIFYTRDAEEAINLVNKEQYKAAFFLNPTLARQIKDISLKAEKMPHKSTYFYPKLLTGLVMRPLNV